MSHTFWFWYCVGALVMFVLQLGAGLFAQQMGWLKLHPSLLLEQTYMIFSAAAGKSIFWPAQILYELRQVVLARGNHAKLRELVSVDLSENRWDLPQGSEWQDAMIAAFNRAEDALVNSPGGLVHPMIFSEVLITIGYGSLREYLIEKGEEEETFATEWYQAQVNRAIKNYESGFGADDDENGENSGKFGDETEASSTSGK